MKHSVKIPTDVYNSLKTWTAPNEVKANKFYVITDLQTSILAAAVKYKLQTTLN